MNVIVYPEGDGVAVLYPSVGEISLGEIARKDVPAGLPYLIIPASDLPQEAAYRDAWVADFSEPHGYGIGAEAWFAEQAGG